MSTVNGPSAYAPNYSSENLGDKRRAWELAESHAVALSQHVRFPHRALGKFHAGV